MVRKYKKSALFKTQFFTTWLSTTLVLVLLGIIVTFVLVARSLSDYVRENINVTVLLEDDLDTARVKDITKQIELKPYARTVEYISQEQALKTLQEELGDNPEEFLGYNPLTASFEIKITADYANNDSIALVAEQLQKEGCALRKGTDCRSQPQPATTQSYPAYRCLGFHVYLFPAHQQHRTSYHLRTKILHQHHEVGWCIVGFHLPTIYTKSTFTGSNCSSLSLSSSVLRHTLTQAI